MNVVATTYSRLIALLRVFPAEVADGACGSVAAASVAYPIKRIDDI